MQLSVFVFGRQVLHVTTDPEPKPPQKPTLEATSGGQFEMGFNTPDRAVINCRRQDGGQLQH